MESGRNCFGRFGQLIAIVAVCCYCIDLRGQQPVETKDDVKSKLVGAWKGVTGKASGGSGEEQVWIFNADGTSEIKGRPLSDLTAAYTSFPCKFTIQSVLSPYHINIHKLRMGDPPKELPTLLGIVEFDGDILRFNMGGPKKRPNEFDEWTLVLTKQSNTEQFLSPRERLKRLSQSPVGGIQYQQPESRVASVINASRWTRFVAVNQQKTHVLLGRPSPPPSVNDFSRFSSLTTQSTGAVFDSNAMQYKGQLHATFEEFRVRRLTDGHEVVLELPEQSRVGSAKWSPDGKLVAYTVFGTEGTYLFVADSATGRSRRITNRKLLSTVDSDFHWTPDSRKLLAMFAAVKPEFLNAPGPSVYVSVARELAPTLRDQIISEMPASNQAIQDLRLSVAGQLGWVSVESGAFVAFGEEALFTDSIKPAPNRQALFVFISPGFEHYLQRGHRELNHELWSIKTQLHRRSWDFNAKWSTDSSLATIESDSKVVRYTLSKLDGPPDVLFEVSSLMEYSSVDSFMNTSNPSVTLVRLVVKDDRKKKKWFAVAENITELTAVGEDEEFVRSPTAVVQLGGDGNSLFVVDDSKSFVDKVDIDTQERTRIWESKTNCKEQLLHVIVGSTTNFIIERESRTEPPNVFLIGVKGEPETQLTANKDILPELTACRRVQLRAKRNDGKTFNVKLTVPREKDDCPVILTLYPEPFESQEAYNAESSALNPFSFPGYPRGTYSVEALVLAGYAVAKMDCPIFASRDEPFDNYLTELQTNLDAVRGELADCGIVDSHRMAVFGYSFGGLAAATAVTQTDYFQVGFAVAPGIDPLAVPSRINYKRRPVWEARDTFAELLHARMHPDKAGPIVLFHGASDTNPMTPVSATAGYYQGLLDAGKEAALYLYPYEGHVFLAKETHLDMTARVHEWLRKRMPVEPSGS